MSADGTMQFTPTDGANALHPPHIRIEGVSKRFGGFTAVRDIDLTIGRGELFALLGGSGCGKTTLLRMLAGFADPSTGRIHIGDRDVTHLPPYERPVNMMFQSYALFPHMTVAANIAFGLKREGLPKPEIARRVEEALALVKLDGLGGRKPAQLSGGQRQRVALARAVVKRPEVLLLDEPMSALDKKLREHTQFELMAIQRQLGITFVMVTHDQEEAMAMATRIAVMDGGRIMQVGSPRDIYETPRSLFVADFIGSVNMLEGQVVETQGAEAAMDCPALGRRIVFAAGRNLALGETVALALRPERITIGQAASGANHVHGQIQALAYHGGASVFRVLLPTGTLLQVTRPNLVEGSGSTLAIGDAVTLSWSPQATTVIET
ncbi:ABC transporter ATP-binding protein [Acidisoma silvae]|uniref:Spermidine/putrescine import ATP-binding protein PotA n=1 Tax=Acidisoma silvae TaxID=2802396 RepID=A0A964DXV5_9PROT|nr:ABC transporter ATP-binding protein [Acidisoma silvae]MCB8874606.1 ABC transporter ATP-binding protein [Acidisoma silvae]